MQGCKIFAILVQCSVLCWIVDAQATRRWRCLDPNTVPEFNITKFTTGRWYEQKRNALPACQCTSMDFILLPANKLNISMRGNCPTYGRGVWTTTASILGSGKFVTDSTKPDYTYHIVDTDYERYAVFWACKPGRRMSTVWISGLTRVEHPSKMVSNILRDGISRYLWESEEVNTVTQGLC